MRQHLRKIFWIRFRPSIELPEPAEKHEDLDDAEDEEVHEYDVDEIEHEPQPVECGRNF